MEKESGLSDSHVRDKSSSSAIITRGNTLDHVQLRLLLKFLSTWYSTEQEIVFIRSSRHGRKRAHQRLWLRGL